MLRTYVKRVFAAGGLIIILLLVITGCGSAPVKSVAAEPEPAKLIYATDLHFYAPELVGDFERFSSDLEYGDGKIVQYSPEIVRTLIDTVLREKPDALLIGGDLSLNGEYESHLELADMLKPVSDAGVPVLVVPGNHDINSLSAFKYATGDSCASIDENGFRELYGSLGMNNAISKDKDSLSYMYKLNDDVYLLMLDTCDYDGIGRSTGSLTEKTVKWIESRLKAAQKAGATVISVSHHNLLQHNPLWAEPFVMHNSDPLVSLLERYGVKLNLTGHMHIQHIIRADAPGGLSEAATGSLLVSPNYYGVLDIGTDKSVRYTAESLDVPDWARITGSTDANLLDFSKYSQEFFERTTRNKVTEALEAYSLSDEEVSQMTDFAVIMNRHYFGGTIDTLYDDLLEHPGYALWLEKCRQEFFAVYIESVMADNTAEHRHIDIP